MLSKKILKLVLAIVSIAFLCPNFSHNVESKDFKNVNLRSILLRDGDSNESEESKPLPSEEGAILVNSATTEEEFIKYLSEHSEFAVTEQFKLTKKIIEAIKAKINNEDYINFEIYGKGILVIEADLIVNDPNRFRIIRGGGKEGSLLKAETLNTPINIKGIEIQNDLIDQPIIDRVDNVQLVFTSNKIFNGFLNPVSSNNNFVVESTSKIIGQDYIDMSAVLKSPVDFSNNLNLLIQCFLSTQKHMGTMNLDLEKSGNMEFKSVEDGKIIDLDGGYTYNLIPDIDYTDEQENQFIIYANILNFNTFNLERANLTHDSVSLSVFFGTNGNDKNGKRQYPLTLEIKDGSGIIKEMLILEGKEGDRKSYTINNLLPNTTYTATLRDNLGNEISKETFETLSDMGSESSNNRIISILSSDVVRLNDVSIAVNITDESLLESFKTGKDFSVGIEGISVSFDGSILKLEGLVPDKEYKNLSLTYVDNKNVKKIVNITFFRAGMPRNSIGEFVVDVYKKSMGRHPDEVGFAYWYKNIESKTVSPQTFVLNILTEKEFIDRYDTAEEKIEAFYGVILGRNPDEEGLKFWLDEYNSLLANGNTESVSLSQIANRMVNEEEFINRCEELFKSNIDRRMW